MTLLDANLTVGELVRERPARARVFEQARIDYCCGGRVPLAEACAKQGVDVDQVLDALRDLDRQSVSFVDADAMGLTELADHIEQTHHVYLRSELPRLDQITAKVASVHGETEPRLVEIRRVFMSLQDELTSHMMKEEQTLFPIIRAIDKADGPVASHCGSIANPIRQMEHEHDIAGDALAQLRQLSDDFTPPDWACNSFRAMFASLEELEGDMHQHIHKENNVLFPKAADREARLTGQA